MQINQSCPSLGRLHFHQTVMESGRQMMVVLTKAGGTASFFVPWYPPVQCVGGESRVRRAQVTQLKRVKSGIMDSGS